MTLRKLRPTSPIITIEEPYYQNRKLEPSPGESTSQPSFHPSKTTSTRSRIQSRWVGVPDSTLAALSALKITQCVPCPRLDCTPIPWWIPDAKDHHHNHELMRSIINQSRKRSPKFQEPLISRSIHFCQGTRSPRAKSATFNMQPCAHSIPCEDPTQTPDKKRY